MLAGKRRTSFVQSFARLHPLVIFSYYIGALALLMLMFHPIILSGGLAIILAIHFVQDRCRNLQRWFFFLITAGLLIAVLNPLFNHRGRTTLFELFGERITLEAVVFGVTTGLSIIGIMAVFVSYNEIMTPNKIFYLFSKFLPQVAVLLMLTLRFIPLMKRRMAEISAVQSSKGISVLTGSLKNRTKAGLLSIQALLSFSLEEAIQTADSMKARGYGQGRRSAYEYFRFTKKDAIALAYLLAMFTLGAIERFFGHGFLTIYPELETLKLSVMDTYALTAMLFYLAFPLFVELGGMIRWHIYN
jgi:energy-coupling factor transport system permease protein